MAMRHSILSVAGLVAMSSAAAMAQYTGVSHPDTMAITTAAPAQASAAVPVDRYAAAQPAPSAQAAPAPPPPGVPVDPYAASPAPAAVVAVGTPAPPLNPPAPLAPPLAYPDQEDGVVVRVPGPSDRLPEGMLMKVRLRETLSTKTTPEGSEWSAELIEPLVRDGQVLVPAGSLLRGKVTQVHGGKRIHGQAEIHLTTLSMTLPDGSTRGLHAQVIDTDQNHALRVDREGTILHRDHRAEEGGVLAVTVGAGAATGAVIAGVPGALVGAGVGAGVSGVLYLKEDKQAELPKNTVITFELTRSMGFGQE
jgi:hypothetical protein